MNTKNITYELLEVADPTTIAYGSLDIDKELSKLQRNLLTYIEFIRQIGKEVIEAEHEYNNQLLAQLRQMNDDWLRENAVNKTNKRKHAELMIHDLQYVVDDLKVLYKWYVNNHSITIEWIQIYKHLRKIN